MINAGFSKYPHQSQMTKKKIYSALWVMYEGDCSGSPHGTTPAAEIANKNKTEGGLRSVMILKRKKMGHTVVSDIGSYRARGKY